MSIFCLVALGVTGAKIQKKTKRQKLGCIFLLYEPFRKANLLTCKMEATVYHDIKLAKYFYRDTVLGRILGT